MRAILCEHSRNVGVGRAPRFRVRSRDKVLAQELLDPSRGPLQAMSEFP